MDRAPLPPHERPWRHPSELAAAEHEPTSTSGRVMIITTATLSLVLIGLLALSMTPDRGAPATVEATAVTTTRLAALEQPTLPMVTPLGDDGWAVTTSDAVGTRAGTMAARLPSGSVVDVEIVQVDAESGVTLVSLPELTHGYQLAATSPAPSDTVVVHGAQPQVVTMLDVSGLDVAEGTPVLDHAGELVGICTRGAAGISIMTVSTMPGQPATSTSAATTTPPTATVAPVAPGVTASTSPVTVATTPPSPTPVVTSAPTTPTSTPGPSSTAPAGGTASGSLSGGATATTAPG